MNLKYLDLSVSAIKSIPLLVNMVSRRVRQLNMGQRPLVKPDNREMPPVDICLKEIGTCHLGGELAPITMDESPREFFSL